MMPHDYTEWFGRHVCDRIFSSGRGVESASASGALGVPPMSEECRCVMQLLRDILPMESAEHLCAHCRAMVSVRVPMAMEYMREATGRTAQFERAQWMRVWIRSTLEEFQRQHDQPFDGLLNKGILMQRLFNAERIPALLDEQLLPNEPHLRDAYYRFISELLRTHKIPQPYVQAFRAKLPPEHTGASASSASAPSDDATTAPSALLQSALDRLADQAAHAASAAGAQAGADRGAYDALVVALRSYETQPAGGRVAPSAELDASARLLGTIVRLAAGTAADASAPAAGPSDGMRVLASALHGSRWIIEPLVQSIRRAMHAGSDAALYRASVQLCIAYDACDARGAGMPMAEAPRLGAPVARVLPLARPPQRAHALSWLDAYAAAASPGLPHEPMVLLSWLRGRRCPHAAIDGAAAWPLPPAAMVRYELAVDEDDLDPAARLLVHRRLLQSPAGTGRSRVAAAVGATVQQLCAPDARPLHPAWVGLALWLQSLCSAGEAVRGACYAQLRHFLRDAADRADGWALDRFARLLAVLPADALVQLDVTRADAFARPLLAHAWCTTGDACLPALVLPAGAAQLVLAAMDARPTWRGAKELWAAAAAVGCDPGIAPASVQWLRTALIAALSSTIGDGIVDRRRQMLDASAELVDSDPATRAALIGGCAVELARQRLCTQPAGAAVCLMNVLQVVRLLDADAASAVPASCAAAAAATALVLAASYASTAFAVRDDDTPDDFRAARAAIDAAAALIQHWPRASVALWPRSAPPLGDEMHAYAPPLLASSPEATVVQLVVRCMLPACASPVAVALAAAAVLKRLAPIDGPWSERNADAAELLRASIVCHYAVVANAADAGGLDSGGGGGGVVMSLPAAVHSAMATLCAIYCAAAAPLATLLERCVGSRAMRRAAAAAARRARLRGSVDDAGSIARRPVRSPRPTARRRAHGRFARPPWTHCIGRCCSGAASSAPSFARCNALCRARETRCNRAHTHRHPARALHGDRTTTGPAGHRAETRAPGGRRSGVAGGRTARPVAPVAGTACRRDRGDRCEVAAAASAIAWAKRA